MFVACPNGCVACEFLTSLKQGRSFLKLLSKWRPGSACRCLGAAALRSRRRFPLPCMPQRRPGCVRLLVRLPAAIEPIAGALVFDRFEPDKNSFEPDVKVGRLRSIWLLPSFVARPGRARRVFAFLTDLNLPTLCLNGGVKVAFPRCSTCGPGFRLYRTKLPGPGVRGTERSPFSRSAWGAVAGSRGRGDQKGNGDHCSSAVIPVPGSIIRQICRRASASRASRGDIFRCVTDVGPSPLPVGTR